MDLLTSVLNSPVVSFQSNMVSSLPTGWWWWFLEIAYIGRRHASRTLSEMCCWCMNCDKGVQGPEGYDDAMNRSFEYSERWENNRVETYENHEWGDCSWRISQNTTDCENLWMKSPCPRGTWGVNRWKNLFLNKEPIPVCYELCSLEMALIIRMTGYEWPGFPCPLVIQGIRPDFLTVTRGY